MNISGQLDFVLRTQSRLDGKWLKTDLQQCFNNDGLSLLWNDMIKDGELIGSFSDGILNSVGVTAKKGIISIRHIKTTSFKNFCPGTILFEHFKCCIIHQCFGLFHVGI